MSALSGPSHGDVSGLTPHIHAFVLCWLAGKARRLQVTVLTPSVVQDLARIHSNSLGHWAIKVLLDVEGAVAANDVRSRAVCGICDITLACPLACCLHSRALCAVVQEPLACWPSVTARAPLTAQDTAGSEDEDDDDDDDSEGGNDDDEAAAAASRTEALKRRQLDKRQRKPKIPAPQHAIAVRIGFGFGVRQLHMGAWFG